MKFKITKVFSVLLKLLTLIAVLGIIIISIAMFCFSFYKIFDLGRMFFLGDLDTGKVIVKSLKAIDSVLLGVIFFIIALGLYELFIEPIEGLPEWFSMKDLDQLKAKMIKVIIVVVAVSFTGRIVTWDGNTNLLGYGIGIGAVIFALSYFLNVKFQKDDKDSK